MSKEKLYYRETTPFINQLLLAEDVSPFNDWLRHI